MGRFPFSTQRGANPVAQQVRVGIFTLLALATAVAIIIYVSDIGIRARGYPIAIHFKDIGALQEGASVQLSGVPVGTVTHIRLLPDQTVLAEAQIEKGTPVYRQSQFIVSTTITGQSTLDIRPPTDLSKATPLSAGVPANPNDAPWGTLPPTIADLVVAGETQLKGLNTTIAMINTALPKLTNKFNNIAEHTDRLITNANTQFTSFSASLNSTVAQLNAVVKRSGHDITALTGNMNALVANNSARVQQLVDSLADTAKNLNTTMANFASITGDPQIKASLVQTAVNFKDASEKLKIVATDLQTLTSDPNVQNQLRGAISNLSDATAKANDILGNFSSATNSSTVSQHGGANPGPAVAPENTPAVTPTAAPAATAPGTHQHSAAQPQPTASPRHGGLGPLHLAEAQVRLNWSNKGGGSPYSDINLTLLPRSPTSATIGVNGLGTTATYNVLINRSPSHQFQFSGGVLYSQLGVKAIYLPGPVGVDARVYNSKNPTLDLYGDLRIARQLLLFYGERNVFGPATQTPTFGLEAKF